jgi:hypothetical protein
VEVLAIEETSASQAAVERYWARWLDQCKPKNPPDHVIFFAATSELVENNGLQSEQWRQRYSRWGYKADVWFIRGHEQGGVV